MKPMLVENQAAFTDMTITRFTVTSDDGFMPYPVHVPSITNRSCSVLTDTGKIPKTDD